MEVFVILFVAWILLGAIRQAVCVTSSSTITVHVTEIRRGDDGCDPPEVPVVPRPEPEVVEAEAPPRFYRFNRENLLISLEGVN